jgi:hypothetical protein
LEQRSRHKALPAPEVVDISGSNHIRPCSLVSLKEGEESEDSAAQKAKLMGLGSIPASYLNLGKDGNNIDVLIVFNDPS